jgi:DMSO reductase anchor subunit
MELLISAGLVVFVLWALRAGAALRTGGLIWVVTMRILLYLLGAGLLGAILLTDGTGLTLARAAMVVLLSGEVIGRWLFYHLQEFTEWDH